MARSVARGLLRIRSWDSFYLGIGVKPSNIQPRMLIEELSFTSVWPHNRSLPSQCFS